MLFRTPVPLPQQMCLLIFFFFLKLLKISVPTYYLDIVEVSWQYPLVSCIFNYILKIVRLGFHFLLMIAYYQLQGVLYTLFEGMSTCSFYIGVILFDLRWCFQFGSSNSDGNTSSCIYRLNEKKFYDDYFCKGLNNISYRNLCSSKTQHFINSFYDDFRKQRSWRSRTKNCIMITLLLMLVLK